MYYKAILICLLTYNQYHFNFSKYRDMYRIVTHVLQYVSYREGTVSLQPYGPHPTRDHGGGGRNYLKPQPPVEFWVMTCMSCVLPVAQERTECRGEEDSHDGLLL